MAVTQQLARLSPAQLGACRSSTGELDRLCSFELVTASDHLDLDWASTPLQRTFQLAQVGGPIVDGLRRALVGDVEVHAADRPLGGTVLHSWVTALDADAVADVATVLDHVDLELVLAVLPEDAEAARTSVGIREFDGHPRPYLHRHLAALRDFYVQAARRSLAVVLWWD